MLADNLSSVVIPLIGPTSGKLRTTEMLSLVRNLEPTNEGGFLTVREPKAWVHRTNPPYSSGSPLTYTFASSVHHARISESRDVVLIHDNRAIKTFEGWNRRWNTLLTVARETDSTAGARFVTVSNGVVIIPPTGNAYFYDGKVLALLGYPSTPPAPVGHGPVSSSRSGNPSGDPGEPFEPGTNDRNFASDGLQGWFHSTSPVFKFGRLGTVAQAGDAAFSEDTPTGASSGVRGYLLPGSYRAVVQWLDMWGNLSPLSGESNEIAFEQQAAMRGNGNTPAAEYGPLIAGWTQVDAVRKRGLWTNVARGKPGTIGRIVGRTKDTKNSGGDVSFYELPLNASEVIGAVATLPDNVTTTYPDNIPDAWLAIEMKDYDPTPEFRVAEQAFGRLWVGDLDGDPGALMISEPGLWGTFPKGGRRWPNSKGQRITGIKAVRGGVLVFTRTSTTLYEANDAGDDFRASPVSLTSGCVAPDSIQTLPNGVTVWLGVDGFYAFDGQGSTRLWGDFDEDARNITQGAVDKAVAVVDRKNKQYMCWVPVSGSTSPTVCWTYDGVAWRQQTTVEAVRGACVLEDGTDNILVAGMSGANEGVFVLGKGRYTTDATVVRTSWLSAGGEQRKSGLSVSMLVREASGRPVSDTRPVGENHITLTVQRDYRAETVVTTTMPTKPRVLSGPAQSEWDITDSEEAKFRERRFFWVRADISVPSCDTLRLTVSTTTPVEIAEMVLSWTIDESRKGAYK